MNILVSGKVKEWEFQKIFLLVLFFALYTYLYKYSFIELDNLYVKLEQIVSLSK